MAGEAINVKASRPLNRNEVKLMTEGNKLHNGLTGKCHETCHYSNSLPLTVIVTKGLRQLKMQEITGYTTHHLE